MQLVRRPVTKVAGHRNNMRVYNPGAFKDVSRRPGHCLFKEVSDHTQIQ